jgi:hypothetical protein
VDLAAARRGESGAVRPLISGHFGKVGGPVGARSGEGEGEGEQRTKNKEGERRPRARRAPSPTPTPPSAPRSHRGRRPRCWGSSRETSPAGSSRRHSTAPSASGTARPASRRTPRPAPPRRGAAVPRRACSRRRGCREAGLGIQPQTRGRAAGRLPQHGHPGRGARRLRGRQVGS